MGQTREYERALTEMNIPQLPYHVHGGYGEPITLLTAVGGLAASVFGGRQAKKQAEAEQEAAIKIAKDQMLINASLQEKEAQASQQHAKNMPLYLMMGLGGLIAIGLLVKKNKE